MDDIVGEIKAHPMPKKPKVIFHEGTHNDHQIWQLVHFWVIGVTLDLVVFVIKQTSQLQICHFFVLYFPKKVVEARLINSIFIAHNMFGGCNRHRKGKLTDLPLNLFVKSIFCAC